MSLHKSQSWGWGHAAPASGCWLSGHFRPPSAPPPLKHTLPSCVKTPTGLGCWAFLDLGRSSYCGGGASAGGRGEWAVDQSPASCPRHLWPENKPQFPSWQSHSPAVCVALGWRWGGGMLLILGTWGQGAAASHRAKCGQKKCLQKPRGTQLQCAPQAGSRVVVCNREGSTSFHFNSGRKDQDRGWRGPGLEVAHSLGPPFFPHSLLLS